MKKSIKGAIFDLDGTLIDSLTFWDITWEDMGNKFLNKKNFRPTESDDKAIRTMTLPLASELVHRVYNIGSSADEVFTYFGDQIVDFYKNKVTVKPGVIEFLDYLKSKDIKMCIASATGLEHIKIAVKHCGLEGYFCDILSCNTIGKGKDQPDIYLLATEKLGTEIDETWVFEDSVVAVNTANKIGLNTVGIYDVNNYGHEELKQNSTIYIDKNEDLSKLDISQLSK